MKPKVIDVIELPLKEVRLHKEKTIRELVAVLKRELTRKNIRVTIEEYR